MALCSLCNPNTVTVEPCLFASVPTSRVSSPIFIDCNSLAQANYIETSIALICVKEAPRHHLLFKATFGSLQGAALPRTHPSIQSPANLERVGPWDIGTDGLQPYRTDAMLHEVDY